MEILTGVHQVVIEAAEPMHTTAAAALQLWRDTASDRFAGDPVGFGLGTIVSDPVDHPLMMSEIPLPQRLCPAEEAVDR